MTVLQGIADGLASAIENTRLVSELKQNLDELRGMNRTYLHQAWSEVTAESGPLSYAYQSGFPVGPKSYTIEIPIMLRDQVIAKLNLETDEPKLTPEQEEYLDALTTQTALALENARLVQKTERRADQEQTLNDLSTRFSNALDIDSILKTAVEALGRLPSVAEVSVELVPPDLLNRPAAAQPGTSQEIPE
jgi:GAF domain-containing protein